MTQPARQKKAVKRKVARPAVKRKVAKKRKVARRRFPDAYEMAGLFGGSEDTAVLKERVRISLMEEVASLPIYAEPEEREHLEYKIAQFKALS